MSHFRDQPPDREGRANSACTRAAGADEPTFQPSDPLTDVATLFGDETRVPAQEDLHRVAARSPAAYGSWGRRPERALEPYGAEQYESNGVTVVARERVQDAILERFAEDIADIDEE